MLARAPRTDRTPSSLRCPCLIGRQRDKRPERDAASPSGAPFFGLAILLLLCAAPAAAQENRVVPPYAWLSLCAREPLANCRLTNGVTVDDAAYVNTVVNEGMKFVEGTGFEVWRVFPEVGDCGDATASKRAALLAYGLAPEKMRIVVAKVHKKSGGFSDHVLLEVDVGGRSYFLDNLWPHVYAADKPPPYKWDRVATQEATQVAWRSDAP